VALTFDDGYDQPSTLRVLAELARLHAPATLFVNAANYAAHPALVDAVRAALRTGLVTLGNHTRTHPRLTTLGAGAVRDQIAADGAFAEATFGVSSAPLFRPPYGAYDATVLQVAGELGYTDVVLWSVDPSDYLGGASETIAERVLQQVSPGGIVLMHLDPSTVAALPLVIERLRARGYKIAGLRSLLAAR
jgi:peptidoglycan/xylan/chitin deacetylase (PgdA/CDA1 family)